MSVSQSVSIQCTIQYTLAIWRQKTSHAMIILNVRNLLCVRYSSFVQNNMYIMYSSRTQTIDCTVYRLVWSSRYYKKIIFFFKSGNRFSSPRAYFFINIFPLSLHIFALHLLISFRKLSFISLFLWFYEWNGILHSNIFQKILCIVGKSTQYKRAGKKE